MTIDFTLWTYFLNADIVVKAVLLLLISASVFSWMIIFQRYQVLKRMRQLTLHFEDLFYRTQDISKLYVDRLKKMPKAHGLEMIFRAGFKECLRLRNHQTDPSAEALMDSAKRAMRVASMREQDFLEMYLPTLATVGSTSPYIGLFGTVWGIMMSFHALAQVQQATISMVAPGIAEALIATAMGLFAAIPAVVAYNRYATEISRLLNRFDAFQDEFANLLYRYAETPSTEKAEG